VKQSDANVTPAQPSIGAALGCIAFGVYLLAGAFRAFTGKWPGFLPPQVDGIALLLSVMPEPYATYAAGAATALLGIGCVGFGIWLWTRPTTRQNKEASDV
jgi:hypothetical protein